MSEYTNGREYHQWFDSLEEMECELPDMLDRRNRESYEDRLRRHEHDAFEWYGCASHRQAMKFITEGWPQLVKELQPMIAELRDKFSLGDTTAIQTEVRRRKIRRGESGDVLDMTRVWNGDLEHAWSKPERTFRLGNTQRYATVFADGACSANVKAEQTLWRAAVSYCAVEILTQMGINTEIWAGHSSVESYPYGPHFACSGVRVKSYLQPLNPDRVCTMLSSAFFRTWSMAMIDAAEWEVSRVRGHVHAVGLVKPLADRVKNGERVFRISQCLSRSEAYTEMSKIINLLKQDKEVA